METTPINEKIDIILPPSPYPRRIYQMVWVTEWPWWAPTWLRRWLPWQLRRRIVRTRQTGIYLGTVPANGRRLW